MHALAGKTFPRVGDTGTYVAATGRHRAPIVVTDVSRTGDTVTVRFLGRDALRYFGAFRVMHRQEPDGAPALYVHASSSPAEIDWAYFRSGNDP
jgi:hypothetical protein